MFFFYYMIINRFIISFINVINIIIIVNVLVFGSMSAIKSYFNALGLYNFIRGFGWAYKRGGGGGLYPGGLTSGIKKSFGMTR